MECPVVVLSVLKHQVHWLCQLLYFSSLPSLRPPQVFKSTWNYENVNLHYIGFAFTHPMVAVCFLNTSENYHSINHFHLCHRSVLLVLSTIIISDEEGNCNTLLCFSLYFIRTPRPTDTNICSVVARADRSMSGRTGRSVRTNVRWRGKKISLSAYSASVMPKYMVSCTTVSR